VLEARFQWSHARDLKPEPEDLVKIEAKLKSELPNDTAPAAEHEKPRRRLRQMVPAEHTLQRDLSSIVPIARLMGCVPRNGGNPFPVMAGPAAAWDLPILHPRGTPVSVTLIVRPATRRR